MNSSRKFSHANMRFYKPNLMNYQEFCSSFSWRSLREELGRPPHEGGLNMVYEAVDRHVNEGRGERVAFRWLGMDQTVRESTFSSLKDDSSRFANVLSTLELQPRERVFVLSERVSQLYIAALGTIRSKAVFCPLFSAFGPEPVEQRMKLGDARVLVTSCTHFERKVKPILLRLPSLRHVILTDEQTHQSSRVLSWSKLMEEASSHHTIAPTHEEDMALLHFTSGTTGAPKGAVHVHEAVLAHHMTGKYILDFHEGDVYWCTADPGWVTGTSYGILSPLTNGVTSIVDEADFDLTRWFDILQNQKVNVLYTSPTALRRMMRVPDRFFEEYDFSFLRAIHSVGEPLNPQVVPWGMKVLGAPIYDNWWQTETGAIMVANFPSLEVQPGSMGLPVPGIEVAVVQEEKGEKTPLTFVKANETGQLAIKAPWPSMFRGYLGQKERYARCFREGWYLSGDLVRKDERGYFWFVGRGDDVIKTAGHMVGPFEVESVLMEHQAIAEAAVIGRPEEIIGEVVKAFVTLKEDHVPSDALKRDILGHVRKRLGPAIAPREIEFSKNLPKNRAGKIVRRLLKAREMGLPQGDTSTLEPPST